MERNHCNQWVSWMFVFNFLTFLIVHNAYWMPCDFWQKERTSGDDFLCTLPRPPHLPLGCAQINNCLFTMDYNAVIRLQSTKQILTARIIHHRNPTITTTTTQFTMHKIMKFQYLHARHIIIQSLSLFPSLSSLSQSPFIFFHFFRFALQLPNHNLGNLFIIACEYTFYFVWHSFFTLRLSTQFISLSIFGYLARVVCPQHTTFHPHYNILFFFYCFPFTLFDAHTKKLIWILSC